MPGLTRSLIDTAGGLVLASPQSFFKVEGFNVAVLGTAVADHGSGSHNAALLTSGAPFFTLNGLAVIIAGKPATCGHLATGSSFFQVVEI